MSVGRRSLRSLTPHCLGGAQSLGALSQQRLLRTRREPTSASRETPRFYRVCKRISVPCSGCSDRKHATRGECLVRGKYRPVRRKVLLNSCSSLNDPACARFVRICTHLEVGDSKYSGILEFASAWKNYHRRRALTGRRGWS